MNILRFLFATGIVFTVIFNVTFLSGLFATSANAAADGWHIKDDATGGECSTIGNWDAGSKTCTLSQDLSQGIIIDSNNIILDGNDRLLTGSNMGNGVYLVGRMGVTIKNLNVHGFEFGIYLGGSSHNTLTSNIAQENVYRDIYVDAYSNSHCDNTIINTTGSGGRPIKYINSAVNLSNETLSELILCHADGSNISNITIDGSSTKQNNGLFIRLTDSSTITNVNSSNNLIGISLFNGSQNTLTDNTANANRWDGIALSGANNNILTSNTANSNSNYHGIYLGGSSHNTLTDNNASNNHDGIYLYSTNNNILTSNTVNYNSYGGIYLLYSLSGGNILTDNIASNNGFGIYIQSSSDNTLTGSTVSNNERGMLISENSSNNQTYKNNFINNSTQASVSTDSSGNIFNLVAPIGGNYWSDYDTPAEGCNNANGDNFCDAPYTFNSDQDNLPWTKKDGWLAPSNNPPTLDDHIYYLNDIPESFIFENDLSPASTPNNAEGKCITKSDVRYLQVILAEEGPSIYPESIINGCFWALTENAVVSFQNKYGIDSLGVVGPITRAKLNERLKTMKESVRAYGSRTDLIKTNINKFTASMVEKNFPSVLALGIASQETGEFLNFNNELLRSLIDPGRGIMQITTKDYVGAGSLEVSDDVTICKNISTWADAKACYRYYANTPRGIEANIKDSLHGLHEKVIWEKLLDRYNICLDDEANGKVSDFSKNLEYKISCADMKYLGAVQGYNSFTKYAHWNSESYMLKISEKLNLLGNIFLLTEDEQKKASDMAINAKLLWDNSMYIRVYSPVELSVIDSKGRATGVKNGQTQELIPFSAWYPGQEAVGINFANDNYKYEVVGTTTGTYGFEIINPAKDIDVFLQNIPTTADTTHQYTIDWNALSRGEKGVTVKVDENGDGVFDYQFNASATLEDKIPPTTHILLAGKPGTNDWYISDVTATLAAEDNTDGVGVRRTEYSFDNGATWQTYTTPLILTQEGIHTLLYRSLDFLGNLESMQTQSIKIDKTPPEAKIFFDQNLKQLKIEGVDNLSSVAAVQNGNNYTLTDEAGHTLVVAFDKLKTEGKEIKAEISALSYNGISIPAIPENKLQYEWSLEKDENIKELNQRVEVENVFDVRAHYDAKKNETIIDTKTGDGKNEEKNKQTFQGFTALILTTNSGKFDISYYH